MFDLSPYQILLQAPTISPQAAKPRAKDIYPMRRSYCYCTCLKSCVLKLAVTVHSWPLLYTVGRYCTQLAVTVHSWLLLYTVGRYCTQLAVTVHNWPLLYTVGCYCTQFRCLEINDPAVAAASQLRTLTMLLLRIVGN